MSQPALISNLPRAGLAVATAAGRGVPRKKMEKLAQAADTLRDRFGFSKVQFGGSLMKRKETVDG